MINGTSRTPTARRLRPKKDWTIVAAIRLLKLKTEERALSLIEKPTDLNVMKEGDLKEDSAAKKQFNWDLTLKVIAAVVSVATLGFGIYQYVVKPRRDNAEKVRSQKVDLYNQAMAHAAAFANASTQAEADAAKKEFWQLYDGKLSAVESSEVKQAMQTFGGALRKWEEFNDPSDFTKPSEFDYVPNGETQSVNFSDLSFRLSRACAKDLEIQ